MSHRRSQWIRYKAAFPENPTVIITEGTCPFSSLDVPRWRFTVDVAIDKKKMQWYTDKSSLKCSTGRGGPTYLRLQGCEVSTGAPPRSPSERWRAAEASTVLWGVIIIKQQNGHRRWLPAAGARQRDRIYGPRRTPFSHVIGSQGKNGFLSYHPPRRYTQSSRGSVCHRMPPLILSVCLFALGWSIWDGITLLRESIFVFFLII